MNEWKSEDVGALAKALADAQAVIRDAVFDKVNPHFNSKFASLASILDAIRPVLSAHGLSVTQLITTAEGAVGIRTVLMHSSGQWLSEDARWPTATTDPQKLTAAITYYRRSSLSALAGITGDEDDDGNAAAKPGPKPEPRTEPKATPKPGPNTPTEKQISAIFALAGKVWPHLDQGARKSALADLCRSMQLPDSSKNMTREQASALIKRLDEMEATGAGDEIPF